MKVCLGPVREFPAIQNTDSLQKEASPPATVLVSGNFQGPPSSWERKVECSERAFPFERLSEMDRPRRSFSAAAKSGSYSRWTPPSPLLGGRPGLFYHFYESSFSHAAKSKEACQGAHCRKNAFSPFGIVLVRLS